MPRRSRRAKRAGFLLRSGTVVPFDVTDPPGMLDELVDAIVVESLEAVARGKKDHLDDRLSNEVISEIQHVLASTPPDIAYGLLMGLLTACVAERYALIKQELQKETSAPPPETIH